MNKAEEVKEQIREAFAEVECPGDWCLRRSGEGDEPYLTEEEFSGKKDWRLLDAEFLDQSPAGFGTALCFLSDEAFRYYLPAYLIADIDGKLNNVRPVYQLCHSFSTERMTKKVNPRRYGERTWFEAARHRFAVFNQKEAAAIVAYLNFVKERNEYDREVIEQAQRNYWNARAEDKPISDPYWLTMPRCRESSPRSCNKTSRFVRRLLSTGLQPVSFCHPLLVGGRWPPMISSSAGFSRAC